MDTPPSSMLRRRIRDLGVRRITAAAVVAALVMTVLDLAWLGLIGRPLYEQEIGHLMAAEVNRVAAAIFYVFYIGTIVLYAVIPSQCLRQAAGRGAGLGFVAYTTYELTNWAVLTEWGALIVPIDILWGVALTSLVSASSYRVAVHSAE